MSSDLVVVDAQRRGYGQRGEDLAFGETLQRRLFGATQIASAVVSVGGLGTATP